MTLQAVCDAWLADLVANTALSAVPVKCRHLYASWSPEQLQAFTNERHVAIWPNGDIESAAGLVTAPADLLTQSYTIVVWEESASEATGLYDDDTANQAWLALYEAVRARLYVSTNRALGDTNIMDTRFNSGRMGMRGAVRWMELEFHVRVPVSFT